MSTLPHGLNAVHPLAQGYVGGISQRRFEHEAWVKLGNKDECGAPLCDRPRPAGAFQAGWTGIKEELRCPADNTWRIRYGQDKTKPVSRLDHIMWVRLSPNHRDICYGQPLPNVPCDQVRPSDDTAVGWRGWGYESRCRHCHRGDLSQINLHHLWVAFVNNGQWS